MQTIPRLLLDLFARPAGEVPTVAQVSTWRRDTSGVKVRTVEKLDQERSVTLVGATVRAACEHGNVVIVGRGGQAVLRGRPGVLHVRVGAPLDDRVGRVMGQQNLDPAHGGGCDGARRWPLLPLAADSARGGPDEAAAGRVSPTFKSICSRRS